jgi:hypothetical protein
MLSEVSSGTAAKAARAGRKANRGAKSFAGNPIVKFGARWGYVVRGLLYGAMGLIALLLAIGKVSHGTDQKGALVLFVNNPVSLLVLSVFAVGLAAYSLWGFVRAVYDPLHRGKDPIGLVARLGFAWSGVAYAALCLSVVQVMLGAQGTLHHDSVAGIVAGLLAKPLGQQLTAIAGAVAIGAGLAQFVDAYRAGWAKDLKRGAMKKEEYEAAVFFGRFGLVSRGVIFTVTGWFILEAALRHDPAKAHGFGAAFEALLREPFGHILVGIVGMGFMALALHSFAYARWVRMMPER